jgi:L-alanine-DL-glutamate epimerase-like enolase superfamily enzyme
MKITNVKVSLHRYDPPQVLGWPKQAQIGILTIETDEDVVGHNFIYDVAPIGPGAAAIADQIIRFVKPMLLGRNPLDIGGIWHDLRARSRALERSVQGYVDVALWDIAGKVAGLPIHRLLGTCRETIPIYASSWMLPDVPSYVDEAIAYKEMGIQAYKLHPPSAAGFFIPGHARSVNTDIEACVAVREAVGGEMTLMLDATWQYSFSEAIKIGRAIEEMDYYWYEDPLKADDIYGYIRLREKLDIPLMATEATEGGLYVYPSWILQKATDFLRADVVIKGGITGLMKIAHLAEAFGMNCEIHDSYNATNNLAGLHAVLAMRNCEYFESLVVNEPGEYGFGHLSWGLEVPFQVDKEGNVHAPEAPGLGAAIDWSLMKATRLGEMA